MLHCLLVIFAFLTDTASAQSIADAFRYPVTTDGLATGSHYIISQGYDNDVNHDGIDFDYACGDAIYAVADGIVTESTLNESVGPDGRKRGYGNLIRIKHVLPNGDIRFSQYGHLEERWVEKDDVVHYGQQIGTMGSTGHSTGCHLHFQIITEDRRGCGYYPGACGSIWVTEESYWETFLDPIAFIESHRQPVSSIPPAASAAISNLADRLWATRPNGGSRCEDGLICEEAENMHEWNGGGHAPIFIEDWYNGLWGYVSLFYDPGIHSSRAYTLTHAMRVMYWQKGGLATFGSMLGDAQNISRESDYGDVDLGQYKPYDPYCDTNSNGKVGADERAACVQEFCRAGTNVFSSMQRFEEATVCWHAQHGFCANECADADDVDLPYCGDFINENCNHQPINSGGGNNGGTSPAPTATNDPVLFLVHKPTLGSSWVITGDSYGIYGSHSPAITTMGEEINGFWYENFFVDVNNDGARDQVSWQRNNGAVYVALGLGNGQFAAKALWANGLGASSSLTRYQVGMADVNGDGKPDIVFYEHTYGYVYVALSTGTAFAPAIRYLSGWGATTNSAQYKLFVADVNGDGRADVILWEPRYGYWYVALSTGTAFMGQPRWLSGWATTTDPSRYSCAALPLNNDNRADLYCYEPATGSHRAALSDGESFDNVGHYLSNWGTSVNAREFVPRFADLDWDGDLDLLLWGTWSGRLWVALNTNGTSFVPESSPWLENTARESFPYEYELLDTR